MCRPGCRRSRQAVTDDAIAGAGRAGDKRWLRAWDKAPSAAAIKTVLAAKPRSEDAQLAMPARVLTVGTGTIRHRSMPCWNWLDAKNDFAAFANRLKICL